MSDQEKQIVMTLKDIQVVLDYLSKRPYAEVFNVVETIKKAKTLESVLLENINTPESVSPKS